MYTVIERFRDLMDDGHTYGPGDTYPRAGLDVSQKRIDELAGTENRLGRPVILSQKPKADAGKRQRRKAKEKERVSE